MLAAIRSRVAVVSARRAFTGSRIVQLRDVGDSVPVNIMNGASQQQLLTCHPACLPLSGTGEVLGVPPSTVYD